MAHTSLPSSPKSGPREQLLLRGAESLSDAELVAVLLGTGSRSEAVAVLSARLLQEAGGLVGLRQLTPAALCQRVGVGPTKAARLCAAIELGVRIQGRPLHPKRPVRSSQDVEQALRPRLRDEQQEHFWALALDVRHRPIALLEIARGGLSQCSFTPGEAFRGVLCQAASAVVFVHNHPSGDAQPSAEDRAMTEQLVQVGDLLGIRVLDHVVLAAEGYFSFLDAGWMPGRPAPSARREPTP